MKRWLKFILLGVLAYAVALVALFPARHAYNLAQPHIAKAAPLTLHDLSGSVWSGRAAGATWHSTPLGTLQWDISPWALLRGAVAAELHLQNKEGQLTSRIDVARDGNVTLRDFDARLPAAHLMLFNPGLPIATDGSLAVRLDEALLPPQGAPALRGTVVWNRALLVAGQPLQLGDLRLVLQPGDNGGTRGTLSDAGGPLEINGTLILEPNRSYRLDAKLRARPEADTALATSLQLLGRPDGRGYYTLRYSGRL